MKVAELKELKKVKTSEELDKGVADVESEK